MNQAPSEFKQMATIGQIAGVLGFALTAFGIALHSLPAALIFAGLGMMAWSAVVAKTIANLTRKP